MKNDFHIDPHVKSKHGTTGEIVMLVLQLFGVRTPITQTKGNCSFKSEHPAAFIHGAAE